MTLPKSIYKPILFALQKASDHLLALDEEACELLDALDQRIIVIDIKGMDVCIVIQVQERQLIYQDQAGDVYDTKISGTIVALFALANQGIAGGRQAVRIEGDAETGQLFDQFLRKLDPDWEEPFTRVFGDFIGHRLVRGLIAGKRWAQQSGESILGDIGEFLQYEQNLVVSEGELNDFFDRVDDIKDDVERFAVRFAQLTSRLDADRLDANSHED